MVLIVILLVTIGFLVYLYEHKWSFYWRKKGIPQVDPVGLTSPINLFKSLFLNWTNVKSAYESSPDVDCVGFYRLRTPMLLIKSPQLVHQILNKDFNYFMNKRPAQTTDLKVDPLSQHLLGLTGDKWKIVRSRLTPAFSSGKIKGSLNLIKECVDEFIDDLLQMNGPVDTVRINTDLIMDIVVSYGFGVRSKDAKELCEMGLLAIKMDFWTSLKRQIRLTFPKLFIALGFKGFNPKVTHFFVSFMKDMFQTREKQNIFRPDFVQLLMELAKQKQIDIEFDDGLLTAQAFSFFAAGFETSGFTQSVMLYELAKNPEIANKARQEIQETVKKHGELNYDALQDMPYLQMVFQETMRKHPADYATPRICNKDYKIPDTDMIIEAGSQIIISMMAIQNDPKYFNDPDHFCPERFEHDNKTSIINGSYLPFGDGPRKCIGIRFAQIQIKYAVARILLEFELILDPRTHEKLEIEEYARTSRHKGPILITFKKIIK